MFVTLHDGHHATEAETQPFGQMEIPWLLTISMNKAKNLNILTRIVVRRDTACEGVRQRNRIGGEGITGDGGHEDS